MKKITKNRIKQIIRESICEYHFPSYDDGGLNDRWEALIERYGADLVLGELRQYLDSDTISEFVEYMEDNEGNF